MILCFGTWNIYYARIEETITNSSGWLKNVQKQEFFSQERADESGHWGNLILSIPKTSV